MDLLNIFRQLPENFIILAPDYKILDASDGYLKVTRREREEIVGLHFLKEAFPDPNYSFEENPVRLSFERVLQTKKSDYMDLVRYQIALPEAEGGGFYDSYWEAYHSPVLDAAGNIAYIVQKTSDVTEIELAKQKGRASEEKFKFLTDSVPLLIHTADAQGQCNYVNQRWLDYTGLTTGDFLGSNWSNVYHPDDKIVAAEQLKEAIAHNAEFQAELRVRDKEGNYRWHLVRSIPMVDAAGNVIMRIGSTYDIHSTKQMVQELLDSNEQMSALSDQVQLAYQKAEDQRLTLERIIMQSPAVINITKGPEHRFEIVNPQYQRLFPNRQLVGRTIAEAIPEAVEQGFIQILDNVYNTREQFIAYEIPFVSDWNDDGNVVEHYFTVTYLPLLEEDKVTGLITFGYMVTDKVKLRKELEALKSAQ